MPGFSVGLYNATFVADLLQLNKNTNLASVAAFTPPTLTAASVSTRQGAPPDELSPFRSSGSNCLWESGEGEPVDRDLADENLFKLYGRVLCIPVAIDGSVQMVSFQIGPYSVTELSISQAYCPRWFPPPFAPPPNSPPLKRPTSALAFELTISEGLAPLWDATAAEAVTRAVFEVFSSLLNDTAPAGFNASVDAIARRRLTSKLLLGAPLSLDPSSDLSWPWLASSLETSLLGCEGKG